MTTDRRNGREGARRAGLWLVAVLVILLVAALRADASAAPAAKRPSAPTAQVLDTGDEAGAWQALPASGVLMTITSEPGPRGRALRVDFDFAKGGGYAVLRRKMDLRLPANYAFTFQMRGACKPNNLEFKLVDDTGDNVWWCNRRDVEFPAEWAPQSIKKRQISYAWGPRGGGELEHVAALEFAITAGQGGKGTVWFDDLALQTLPLPSATPPPILATASSAVKGHEPAMSLDATAGTAWVNRAGDKTPSIQFDLQAVREFGGLLIDWADGGAPANYDVEAAGEDGAWRVLRTVTKGDGGRDYLALPESEARLLRIRPADGPGRSYGLVDVAIMPLDWAATPDQLTMAMARDAHRGDYPRGYFTEQSYWTVVGVDGDPDEGLFDEDARLETGRAQFSIEPFLRTERGFYSWADVKGGATQQDGYLPLPSVRWTVDGLELTTTVFARGERGASSLVARYVVRNSTDVERRVTLHLAIRPFQVNPPSQFLNVAGGAARIEEIEREGAIVRVNGTRAVIGSRLPTRFGAIGFDEGNLVAKLRDGAYRGAERLRDPIGRASGVLSYELTLQPHLIQEVALEIPFGPPPVASSAFTTADAAHWQAEVAADWHRKLDVVGISLGGPGADVANTLRAQLGYVLVNRDGAGIQPGSRSYERSWIRDGSLTSSALLRMGLAQPVKEYLEWFAPHQYADGKVPCCVDWRGSDPVPENDSHGELVFLAAEYLRLTGDRATVERIWPNVRKAVAYMDTLRAQRRTAEWRTPANAPYFGLLPPSISHEGYSAKPMHSYWDDLFALRGYKDGTWLAEQLGRADDALWMARSRDEFTKDFGAAVRAAMAAHHIDYVPGCSDLGDFDATSTTIAMAPVQAERVLPDSSLERTFQRYWEFFERRRSGAEKWDAYTPYELRTIGAFVHLGWRDRAHELMAWFFGDRRPEGWHQWAEVVDPVVRHPRFLGDMPHTWVGTDYVRSVLDMLAFERESDSALVIAAGVPEAWLADSGVVVHGLRTRWGTLSYSLRRVSQPIDGYELRVDSEGLRVPPGGIDLGRANLPGLGNRFAANGKAAGVLQGFVRDAAPGSPRVTSLPFVMRWPKHYPRGSLNSLYR